MKIEIKSVKTTIGSVPSFVRETFILFFKFNYFLLARGTLTRYDDECDKSMSNNNTELIKMRLMTVS